MDIQEAIVVCSSW